MLLFLNKYYCWRPPSAAPSFYLSETYISAGKCHLAEVKRGDRFRGCFVVVPLLLLFTPLWRLRQSETYALRRFRCYLQHVGVWARRVFCCRAAFATIYTTLACPENRNICSQAFSLLFTACGRLGETGPRGGVPLLLLFTSLWRVRHIETYAFRRGCCYLQHLGVWARPGPASDGQNRHK